MKEDRPKSKNLKSLGFLLGFLKPYKLKIFNSFLALCLTSGLTLLLGQGLRILVDEGFMKTNSSDVLGTYALIFLGLVALLSVFTFIRHYLVSWLGERVTSDIRTSVFNHVIDLHPGYFETNLGGEIQSRITTDTLVLQTIIGSSISMALRNVMMLIGGVAWLFITNVKLTMIIMISIPFVIGPILIFGRRVRRLSRDNQDKIASIGTFVGEMIRNIKTVQAYNHQNIDKKSFHEHVDRAFVVAKKRIIQRSWLMSMVVFLVLGAIAAMFWVGGRDVIAGKISVGDLTAFTFYSFIIATSAASISGTIGDIQRAAGATERLVELLHAPNKIKEPKQAMTFKDEPKGALRIENVTFSYPTRLEQNALQNFSLSIQPGETIALVGHSGAGKSTLFDLLLRFYDCQKGAIYLDDVPIRQLKLQELRQNIAIVSQQPNLFTGTVLENIRYGRPCASKEEIINASLNAYADEFIKILPEGYDSYLGESGQMLSGGQKQRIAIARAILKDPKVLLLDEATSALDAQSEYMVQNALAQLMNNRTTIVIAHRLATVVKADKIALVHQSELVALGTHHELLQNSSIYARLAQLQFNSESLETTATAKNSN